MQVKFLNIVWVESSAVGRITVSEPSAEITGSAMVREHFPRHEISWMVSTRFICRTLLYAGLPVRFHSSSGYGRRSDKV